uniref:(northern house mosquito) hypothetical protein n=1 Tax=Culex pipiens TaxID=7175 RepID=A0A8D8F5X9_CULPI
MPFIQRSSNIRFLNCSWKCLLTWSTTISTIFWVSIGPVFLFFKIFFGVLVFFFFAGKSSSSFSDDSPSADTASIPSPESSVSSDSVINSSMAPILLISNSNRLAASLAFSGLLDHTVKYSLYNLTAF